MGVAVTLPKSCLGRVVLCVRSARPSNFFSCGKLERILIGQLCPFCKALGHHAAAIHDEVFVQALVGHRSWGAGPSSSASYSSGKAKPTNQSLAALKPKCCIDGAI